MKKGFDSYTAVLSDLTAVRILRTWDAVKNM